LNSNQQMTVNSTSDKSLNSDHVQITRVPDLSDHPLVVGPRYVTEDFHIRAVDLLGKHASGVLVLGIGRGAFVTPVISRAKLLRVYQVKGRLGLATENFSPYGRVVQRSTYHHVTLERIDRIVAGMQAGHQKYMFTAAGVDIQTQEAYEMASEGLLRPADSEASGQPLIYGMKCIHFDLPDFTLEIHAIDEPTWYLMKVIHEIGLEARSTAVCTGVRRLRYGPFELVHSLLMKHCDAPTIIDNIRLCRSFVSDEYLVRSRQLGYLNSTTRPALLELSAE